METIKKSQNIFLRMHPIHRVLISIGLSLLTYLLICKNDIRPLMFIMIMWDVFSFSYILTSWIVCFTRAPEQIRVLAKKEDGSRLFVLTIILISSFVSVLNVLLLITSKEVYITSASFYLPIALAGMLFSWILIHTIFGFHYAHMYYGDHTDNPAKHAEGLIFPKEKEPDYIDFAYFSFVIGMTFQVSDVEITSRKIRRLVLLHALLAFGLYTVVLALAVNFIGSLKM